MHRVWDYISFAAWFAGCGYIVMWLLRSPDLWLLPPALHVIGVASAIFADLRMVLHVVRRRRAAVCSVPARKPAAVLRPPRRRSSYPLCSVKPRSHFGLRGMPD